MDWSVVLGAGAFAISLTTAISALMYLIMRLMVQPIKEDLDELKRNTAGIKTDAEIARMIDLAIAKHKEECQGSAK